eukprot:9464043-Lingulodinium_polyedra.AAC.1
MTGAICPGPRVARWRHSPEPPGGPTLPAQTQDIRMASTRRATDDAWPAKMRNPRAGANALGGW